MTTRPSEGARSKAITVASLATLFCISCGLQPAPDPGAGLGPRAQVFAPVLDEEIGELFTTDDGLWAFKASRPASIGDYEVGQVAAFGDLDEQQRHLFAVVSTQSWGVLLQRLDAGNVEGRTFGSLIPLSGLDRQTGVRWSFCSGSGDPTESECLVDTPPGTQWRLYPLDSDGVALSDEKTRRDAATLPVPLSAIVTTSSLGVDVVGEPPDAWLAVRGETSLRPTHPRIAVAPECDLAVERDALQARWFAARFDVPTDVAQVSDRAYEHGADALVWCSDGKTHIAAPSLFRPRLELTGRGFSLPSLVGAVTVTLQREERASAPLVARLAGAAATGDFASADYFAEQLLRTTSKGRRFDNLAVRSMSTVAAGGRPEAAARMGKYATRLEWNPQNSPGWVVGMAAVESRLGNKKSAITRTQLLGGLLDRSDADLRGWFVYFESLPELTGRGGAAEELKRLEPYPSLHLLARAKAAGNEEKLTALESDFDGAGLGALHDAMIGELGDLPCERPCVADSYGRLWAAGKVESDTLSRVGEIDLRPGYGSSYAEQFDGLDRVRNLVMLYPLLESGAQQQAVDMATQASIDWASKECGADSEDAMRQLIREAIDAALRMDDWQTHPLDATMAWLAIRGIPAVCGPTDELAVRAAELAENIGSATAPARLLQLHVDRAEGADVRPTLETAARYALDFERGERCLLWTTALAAANASAARLQEARTWSEAAAKCDVSSRGDIDVVSAFLNFQRSGTISADFARPIRDKLALAMYVRMAPDTTCVGTTSLDYDLTPQLSKPVRALVKRLSVDPRERPQDLSVVSASDRLLIASEHLGDVYARMTEAKYVEAAKSLGFARDAFEALRHQPGLARVQWLSEVIFDGRTADVAAGEVDFAKVAPRMFRRKTIAELAAPEDGKVDPTVALIVTLLKEDAGDAEVAESIPSRGLLCDVRVEEPRGTVLDRRDGQLERTGEQ